jgi:hypothetical protein
MTGAGIAAPPAIADALGMDPPETHVVPQGALAPLPAAAAALVGVAALVIVMIPFLWPVAANVSAMAHEGAHALMASVMGFALDGITLERDGTGATFYWYRRTSSSPARLTLTGFVGYLGPSVFGLWAARLIETGHVTTVLWIVKAPRALGQDDAVAVRVGDRDTADVPVRVVRGYDGAAVRDRPGDQVFADRRGQVDHEQVLGGGRWRDHVAGADRQLQVPLPASRSHHQQVVRPAPGVAGRAEEHAQPKALDVEALSGGQVKRRPRDPDDMARVDHARNLLRSAPPGRCRMTATAGRRTGGRQPIQGRGRHECDDTGLRVGHALLGDL